MNIFEAIEGRHSVRKFKTDIPPVEDIKKIIDAARLAPSPRNSQMWHYVVIYNAGVKQKIKQAIIAKYDEIISWPESSEKIETLQSYKEFSTFFTDAPVNIAVFYEARDSDIEKILRKRGLSEEKVFRARPKPELLGVGAAIENISLAAHSLGYGSCWLTAPICAYEKVEELLGAKKLGIKGDYKLVSFMCLGVPDEIDVKRAPKKELSEIMTVIE